ncbi:Major Facilitator Superfamily [Rhizoctonia solani]|uniref:Major Facilitator Superfamily n=1 Tax=Rhizoctonia solani TaxID=456999 RepID=A0A8H7M483_9AGAM|nr:Major Facilitator Superfamily [Rhizoctonia solani]
MTQTATCEIELLDALPHLESGSRFDRAKTLPVQTPHATTNNPDAEYFSGINALEGHGHPTGSGYSLPTPPSTPRFLSCMGIFVVGLNETATGANLPSFQDYYHLPYDTVSLVFLGGFIGYLISCMLNSVLQNAIGTRNVLLLAGALYAGGSLLISFAPPFPAVMVGLCFMGFGAGFYEAALTSVVSHFEDNRYMNILYAFSGLVSPFIIGALAKIGAAWKLYYWFPFVLASLITGSHFIIFRNYSTPSDREEVSEHEGVRAKFKRVVHMPIAWIGIVLLFLSFSIAHVFTSDLARMFLDISVHALGWPDRRKSLFLLAVYPRSRKNGNTILLVSMCGAIGLFWAVNSTPSNWIGIAAAGFFLGPNTPGILSIISARAPPSLKGIVISSMIGLGLAGTLAPLVFGVVIERLELNGGIDCRTLSDCTRLLIRTGFLDCPPRRKVD